MSVGLFNIALESDIKKITINQNGTINDRFDQVMAYTDNVVVIIRNREWLQ